MTNVRPATVTSRQTDLERHYHLIAANAIAGGNSVLWVVGVIH
jgi:hypothetical protein